MKQLSVLIPIILLVTGCRKEIKFTGEMTQPKLVVNCLLEAGNTIEVYVSKSAPITSNTEPIVLLDAQVEMFENAISIGFGTQVQDQPGTYFFDHEVINGKTYRVEVEYLGLESVYAETQVPLSTPGYIASITTESPPLDTDYSNYSFQLDYVIQDSFADQYYLFYLEIDNAGQRDVFPFHSIEPVLERQTELYYDGGLFSDASFNGSNYTLDVNISPYENLENYEHFVILRTLNLDLFRYMQSTRFDNDGILTEPVQIYSNIENGIGVFAASSEFEVALP